MDQSEHCGSVLCHGQGRVLCKTETSWLPSYYRDMCCEEAETLVFFVFILSIYSFACDTHKVTVSIAASMLTEETAFDRIAILTRQ